MRNLAPPAVARRQVTSSTRLGVGDEVKEEEEEEVSAQERLAW